MLKVRDAVNALRNAGAKFGQIWIDVEIYNWGSDKTYNRQFILDMVAEVRVRLGRLINIRYTGVQLNKC